MNEIIKLGKWEEAKRAVAECETFDDVMKIKDQAVALKAYAEQIKESLGVQNKVTAIKIRAEIKAGALLKNIERKYVGFLEGTNVPKQEKTLPQNITKKKKHIYITLADNIKEDKVDELAEECTNKNVELSTTALFREVKQKEAKKNIETLKIQPIISSSGEYKTIVIDPPWGMQKIEREISPNQVGFDYPTMTQEELLDFELPADKECHLYLWTTQKFIWDAKELMDYWDFKYIFTMTWYKNGGFQPFGLPQYNSEFCLFGRRGNLPFLETKNFFTCNNWPRREHSRKPDEFYELVERVSPAPRIDIFSREKRNGFAQYGNETNKF